MSSLSSNEMSSRALGLPMVILDELGERLLENVGPVLEVWE